MGTVAAILGVLGPLAALGYGVWRKYLSPEAELAKLKEEHKAREAAARVEAERLAATFTRISKEKPNETDVLNRLNRPIK